MEQLTNEEIARIFALYYGCKCSHTGVEIDVDFNVIGDILNSEFGKGWFTLLLTPLSEITDEHKSELKALVDSLPALKGYENLTETIIDWHLNQSEYTISVFVADFLRSKGYALPYMGHNLFELGIAKNIKY